MTTPTFASSITVDDTISGHMQLSVCVWMHETSVNIFSHNQWVWVSVCVHMCVKGSLWSRGTRSRDQRGSVEVERPRALPQQHRRRHPTSQELYLGLIVPHRSQPFVATFQSCFRTKTKGKYLHLVLWLHLSPCSSFFCRCMFVSAPLAPIQTVTLYFAHILLYNDLSVWSKQ